MKKIMLSVFVILSFFVYSIHQRKGNVAAGTTSIQNTTLPVSTSKIASNNNSSNGSSVSAPNNNLNNDSVGTPSGAFKDGTYTGDSVNAYYGDVQVKAIIKKGQITDVQFLNYPQDRRTSAQINSYATGALTSEAIQSQSANVDIVSGATLTSEAFRQSLQSAINKAQS